MSNDGFDLSKILETFVQESRELLDDMDATLLDFEKGDIDPEKINLLFRVIHTIKGSSGMFGCAHIEKFTHIVENVLDRVREGKVELEKNLISLLFDTKDHILDMIDDLEKNPDSKGSEKFDDTSNRLLDELSIYDSDENNNSKQKEKQKENVDDNIVDIETKRVESEYWHMSVRFKENFFKNGMDPKSFISYLSKISEIENIVLIQENIPPLSEINVENCYLDFEINFKSSATKNEISDIFDVAHEDCDLRILPPKSNIKEYVKLIFEMPERSYLLGEILTEIGSLTNDELETAIDMQMESAMFTDGQSEKKLLGEILVDNKVSQKQIVDAAIAKQSKFKKTGVIKIGAEKLDNLVNLVGELVISGATFKQILDQPKIERSSLVKSLGVLLRLIEDIRDNTMNMRMIQIGDTFKRFERIVRDLGKERGKEIDLVMQGGETELDRNLIEKINDPLMHLVRNAVDHGIDLPENRLKKGKHRRGIVKLNAYNESGNIVIEISDNGDGINKNKIIEKAKKVNLISDNHNLSEKEIFQLIFTPGFSTADTVSKISGRGVGMDVVKRNIEELRGSIDIFSEEGEGTTFKLTLPLTLAIIDGFMFKVDSDFYIIPLNLVHECTEIKKQQLYDRDGGNFINLRGEVLPFIKLRDFLNIETEEPDIQNVLVVEHSGEKAGIVVDTLVGEFQTVIKPLGELFARMDWISGTTILGTGEVAFILDVIKLIDTYKNDSEKDLVINE